MGIWKGAWIETKYDMLNLQSEDQNKNAQQLEQFFSPEGTLAVSYGGKSRWSQSEMAQTINRNLFSEKSLLVEAPTGTGKTLAYLIPIAYYLQANPAQRFVISVSTKHLQSQIEKDLNRFSKDVPQLADSAVLKGASNYLCLNRMKKASARSGQSKQVRQDLDALIKDFGKLENLPHGWREELPFKINDQTWSLINGEGSCCKMGFGCYRKQARKLATEAKIVIVNTDLLGYNIKFTGNPVPCKESDSKPFLIMDEAHALPNRLIEVESADVSFRTLDNAINILTRDAIDDSSIRGKVQRITINLDAVRQQILNGPDGQVVIKPEEPTGTACKALVSVIRDIKDLATIQIKSAPNDDVRADYQELETKLQVACTTLDGYLDNKLPNYTLLLNRSTSFNGATALNLELKPFDLKEPLQRMWDSFKQVTLVSATLIGTSIAETQKTFNAPNWETTNFPSPFKYKSQMRVYLPPKQQDIVSPEAIAETIKQVATITDGRVMSLFTNYKTIAEVTQLLTPWCKENDIQLYPQERNLSPERLVSQYEQNPKAIILGNQSMGTGVDIRLRALIITKIPFEQQSPYKEAKQQFLKNNGIDPFYQDTLPDTVRKWKQWWGRLIRDESQKGLLVVLDPKLNTATYAKSFLNALPQASTATHLYDTPLPTKSTFLKWIGVPEVEPVNPTIS